MTEIHPFTFPDTGQPVRSLMIDGDPWFILTDAAKILGYRDAEQASRLLRHAQLSTIPDGTWRDLGGRGSAPKIVTEGGLYRLVMRSNVVMAERFQDWVTDEVLPAIRRTGAYSMVQYEIPRTLPEALRAYAAEIEDHAVTKAALGEAAPKAESWDTLATAKGDFSVADAAKILSRDPSIKIGRDRLFEQMADYGWLYRQRADKRWRAYQSQVNSGRFTELLQSYEHPRTGVLTLGAPQVRLTVKCLHELHRRLGGTRQLQIEGDAS